MLSAQVCSNCEYCTDCSKRKVCAIRKMFYSDSEYAKWRKEAIDSANALSSLVFPGSLYYEVTQVARIELQAMDARRKQELKLHPTYSQD